MVQVGSKEKIILMGAGLVGSLLGLLLARRGYEVTIYERRPDMRKANLGGGRSINLALSNRGLQALQRAGLSGVISDMVVPMKGRMMHDETGKLTYQPYGKEGQVINSVSRGGLNQILVEEAERAGVSIYFEHRCLDVDFTHNTVHMEHGGREQAYQADLLIGTDGAFSAVRTAMMKTDRFNYKQEYIPHGYKELTIPAAADGSHQLEPHYLHIWPRGEYMLIALPNQDGSFTCTLFFPYEGEPSFESLQTESAVMQFFESVFPDATALIPNLSEDFFRNPTASLVSISCWPWQKNGKAVIMGDASHAIVPFYGQGMNSGFEDCYVFDSLIEEYGSDWSQLLSRFEELRKPDADAIRDLALHNFVEMRDHVADEQFLLRKQIESKLHELYPKRWIPLYSMVTFQEGLRYSEALSKGKLQDQVMSRVMNRPGIAQNWQSLDLEEIVREYEALQA